MADICEFGSELFQQTHFQIGSTFSTYTAHCMSCTTENFLDLSRETRGEKLPWARTLCFQGKPLSYRNKLTSSTL